MPQPQQRYTPVPGMGRTESGSFTAYNEGPASRAGNMEEQDIGHAPSRQSDPFHTSIPPAHRLSDSYSDPFTSRPNSSVKSPPHSNRNSYTERALPAIPAAGAAGAATVAYAVGPSHGDHGFSNMPIGDQYTGAGGATSDRMAYQNIPSEQYWTPSENEKPGLSYGYESPKKSHKKAWIIGGVLGAVVVAAIVGGVVGGVMKSKGGNGGSSSSNSGNSNGATLSNPDDPSNFAKDPNLHQSFWGFAYTPEGTTPPYCSGSQVNTTRDIQLLSQLTTRLRLYGANCNTTAMVLQAIKDTKVNMTIWPAIYVDSNTDAYETQLTAIQDAIKAYGVEHIAGITVGNEYILNTAGTNSNTSSVYLSSVRDITTKITEVKTMLSGMNLPKTLEVGTSDAGSVLSTTLARGIDYFMANVHPYFGGLAINDAAEWTWEFFQNFDVSVAATAPNKPNSYIAETGWPTASLNGTNDQDGAGIPQGSPSTANLQTFLDTFVCQSNAKGTHYFYFEAFDEPWKRQFGGVEPYWGLFHANRTLKSVTIPTC